MKTGLLLIDIQNDYFKGGANALYNSELAVKQARKVLEHFRKQNAPVFHVQHISIGENATFFKPDTEGVKIHEAVAPYYSEPVIIKHAPDSFFETTLKASLDQEGIDELVICGMMTHMCIDTTVRAARNYGYKVVLLEDACATKNLKGKNGIITAQSVHNAFVAALGEGFAQVCETEPWLAACVDL